MEKREGRGKKEVSEGNKGIEGGRIRKMRRKPHQF
jgi:hypothetical protein